MTTLQATLGGRPVAVHLGRSTPFPPDLYGLDVETTFLTDLGHWDPDFRVRTVQVATEDEAWVFRLPVPGEAEAARAVLSDPAQHFTSHSNMDVLSVALGLGVDIVGRNLDTLSLAQMAIPDKMAKRDLKTLAAAAGMPELAEADAARAALFREMWPGRKNAAAKDVDAHGWSLVALDDPTFLIYAGLDAIAVRRLAPALARATRAPAALLRVERTLAEEANRLQLRGMRVDVPALDELAAEHSGALERHGAAITELTGGTNPKMARSPALQPWLAEHGVDWSVWPGARSEKTNNPSLAKENVRLLLEYPLDAAGAAVVSELIEFKAHQDVATKCAGVRAHLTPDGRVHPALHPMGATTTARMSSSGPNVQNFSKKDPRMRGIFVPAPGHVFMTCDFAQVELRVVAALAREERMISTILAGGDLHQLTVDMLARVGIVITRDTGKTTNFLIVYGGGAKALHDQTGIPLDIAAQIIAAQKEAYPSITAYAEYLGLEREAIRTISGRRLPVTRNKRGELRTYATVNYAVQSAARELIAQAWLGLRAAGRAEQVWMLVHDEIVLEVPDDAAQIAAARADVEAAMRFDFRGVPITADAVVLRDETGASRWMTSKRAEAIAARSVAA